MYKPRGSKSNSKNYSCVLICVILALGSNDNTKNILLLTQYSDWLGVGLDFDSRQGHGFFSSPLGPKLPEREKLANHIQR
jgi:hypothetical protein